MSKTDTDHWQQINVQYAITVFQQILIVCRITWIAQMRHMAAEAHNSPHMQCMLEWLLSGQNAFTNYSPWNIKRCLIKSLNAGRFQLHGYIYVSYRINSTFKPAWIFVFCRLWPCHSIDRWEIIENILWWYRSTLSRIKQNKYKLNHHLSNERGVLHSVDFIAECGLFWPQHKHTHTQKHKTDEWLFLQTAIIVKTHYTQIT